MKKLVQIPRFPELPTHLVMDFVFNELTPGFQKYGFEVRVVTNKEYLEDGGILFFDDKAYNMDKSVINNIANRCPNSICVCWYWTDTTYKPFKYMIHTGEYNMIVPKRDYERERFFNYMRWPTYVPLIFRPNEDPDNIGTYARNPILDYCYMGAKYKPDWVPSSPEFQGLYRAGDWNVYLSYEQRRAVYLSSIFALGFHDILAIESGSISARIFEGLTYGCVVFCESKFVCEYTDNIVVHIESKEDLEEKMRFYKANPDLIAEKQRQGYEWMKTKGMTNQYSCELYIKKCKDLYNIEFE